MMKLTLLLTVTGLLGLASCSSMSSTEVSTAPERTTARGANTTTERSTGATRSPTGTLGRQSDINPSSGSGASLSVRPSTP